MGATKLLILENSLGQKIRTFAVDSESLHLVYILESRRVEAVADLSSLDKEGVEYQLLQKIKENHNCIPYKYYFLYTILQ